MVTNYPQQLTATRSVSADSTEVQRDGGIFARAMGRLGALTPSAQRVSARAPESAGALATTGA